MRKPLLVLSALVSLIAPPAAAGDAFGTPVTAEVLSGWTLPDGRRMAGLQLTLAPGWKTYWRVPGDSGIPPRFSWRGARNVQNVQVSWPTPEVFVDYGMRSYGYRHQVTLPLAIAPKAGGRDIRLKGRMHLGICSDICVPYELRFDETLAPPAPGPTPEIVAALAAMPYSAEEGDVRAADCTIRPNADGMRIEAQITLPHTGGTEVAVIEPGLPNVWTSDATSSRAGQVLTATSDMMHLEDKAFSIDRSRVRITVIGQNYAVDIQGCQGG